MNIQSLIEKWELEIAKVTPKEDEGGKWYDHEWSNGRYGAISEFLADIKQLNLPLVSGSLPNETTKGHWEWDSKFNTYKYIIH